mmetsp:Transcript_100537/g.194130  ORF Transcript_100537/g.194130 Transcript_100537/m.194130 type:complete len:266 (-) Transcript_100537:26-823(-)
MFLTCGPKTVALWMLGGGKLAFSFSKKAEPKRVVESLKKAKTDVRQEITCLEAGQIHVNSANQAAHALTIPCKNSLQDVSQARRSRAQQATQNRDKAAILPNPGDGFRSTDAGLPKNISQLSAEDEEAARALLNDAASGNTGSQSGKPAHAPILMRNASKRAREGEAPEAKKDMFDKVPVESFGEALLRGMGYDPNVHNTKPVYHDKLRDSLLGLGAKALLPSEKMMLATRKKGAAASKDAASAEVKQSADAQSSNAAAPSSAVK